MASVEVSKLRIVLLGKNLLKTSQVANSILGRSVLEDPPHSGECYCESLEVAGRSITLINTPHLFDLNISLGGICQRIKQCVSLSKPGPHAFLLVVESYDFTEEDRTRLTYILSSFSEEAINYSILINTDSKGYDSANNKQNTVIKKITEDCDGRHHSFSQLHDWGEDSICQLYEKIDQMVKDNGGEYLLYKILEDAKQTFKLDQEPAAKKQKTSTGSPQDKIKSTQLNVAEHVKRTDHSSDLQEKEKNTKMEEIRLPYEEREKAKTEQLFIRLNLMEKYQQKMKTSDVLQITSHSLNWQESCKEKDVVETFLQRLLMMDYRARFIITEAEETTDTENTEPGSGDKDDVFLDFFCNKTASFHDESHKDHVHPMDVQMAVFHCSDHFLKQLIVNKLAQCQYALPLLVPNPFTREIEIPLWTFHQIIKSWKTTDSSGKEIIKTQAVYEAETPMVAFFRFGSTSSSKSQLINHLINEKHHTFFHRHCPGSGKNRLLMDGVVEVAWYCPSGNETDYFPDCVAFCNLHGDAETNKEQLEILTEMSSVNVIILSNVENIKSKEILQNIFRDTKPLICLLSEDESSVTRTRNRKYRIGLKERNQSDVAKNLRMTIEECLLNTSIFKIEDSQKFEVISNDEDDSECKRGKEAAENIMSHLKGTEVSKLKEKHLPCQGKLWLDWSKMNKDLHRLQGNNLEKQKSEKQREMKQIREKQHEYRFTGLMENFISSLKCLNEKEKLFFLKWAGILLDKHTSDDLLDLYQKYNEKWTAVLDLKKKHDKSDKMKEEQNELEYLSEKLNAAAFGLWHILREMGQIYESFISVQAHTKESHFKTVNSLAKLAAELMKSGHPLELMDGDSAHVPLIWVSAVLDELVEILGEQRVFVVSVLGVQSSGKSTLLNTMFGLQFAVSAGRCTRGAFMQLVRVSEEMKEKLKFDYILVVDTEGLRAPELTGKSTRHHDNELATFVVGLGNLTLINIFGENPVEMQDILQIVVQAFLRMKKVRLNPRCMFVHQNVSVITAEEKNMEGRRHLQEKLDEMTKLAAKEEDSEAECFSDVIEFSVLDDVYYFAQLWEGSPPMAPPNPCYSANVHSLKNDIFKHSDKSTGMSLSQFKSRVSDLWNAILSENFVFSFKNTLEISVYRKLETEFGKWTWALRSAMLDTEEKLQNRIENEKLTKVTIAEKDIYSFTKKTKNEVDQLMKNYFEEDKDKDILIQWRSRCENKITQLYEDLVKDTKQSMNEVIHQQQARESFELFSLSKNLALQLKAITTDEQALKDEFDKLWDKWVTELTRDILPERTLNFWEDVVQILSVGNEPASVCERKKQQDYKHIDRRGDYSHYISNLKSQTWVLYIPGWNKPAFEDNELVRTLIINVIKEIKEIINKICNKITRLGYKYSYIQEITDHVRKRVEEHQSEDQRIKLKKEFTLDLCLHVCELASHRFTECHKQFREANDPRVYLSKQKPRYYIVFKNYCKGTTAAKVFGDLICSNLRESILQSVYNKTAIGLAAQIRSDIPEFNGNRSNLEKHILTCLAEEENFEKYMEYIHHPRKHFEDFITEKVNQYITDNNTRVLKLFKGNLKDKEQRVINAVHIATGEVKKSRGDADMWLRSFRSSLTDDLSFKEITFIDHREITDFDFLQQVVGEGLTVMMSELDKSFNSVKDINMEEFRKKPDEILIEHLCQCCWVQCPFCKVICTNTMEGHDGDHSVPFHRVNGTSGESYRGTTDLCCNFCTTNVQTENKFYPAHNPDMVIPYKTYRSAGGVYETWSITPDNSQLTYWKWFVCKFQEDLEKFYEKTFEGKGEIPSEWRDFTKGQVIESLNEYF